MDRSGRVIDAVPKCLDCTSWVRKAHYRGEMVMARSYLCFRWLTPVSVKRPDGGWGSETGFPSGSETILQSRQKLIRTLNESVILLMDKKSPDLEKKIQTYQDFLLKPYEQ